MLENLIECIKIYDYPVVDVLIDSKNGLLLFDALLDADVNGFKTQIFEEDTYESARKEILDKDYCIIALADDGIIYTMPYKVGLGGIGEDGEFVYLVDKLTDKWLDVLKKRSSEVLVFSFK